MGPYDVLARVPGAEVTFVAAERGPVRTETDSLALVADRALAELTDPDIVVVPGGYGNRELLDGGEVVEWLRQVHAGTSWTTSVCTGALLLGAAGILDGLEATTHWAALELLPDYGAQPVQRRVVTQGKVITAAGVSAGIDMALHLAAQLAGPDVAQAIQLGIEYDPQPPFDAGSPDKAPAHIVELLRSVALTRGG